MVKSFLFLYVQSQATQVLKYCGFFLVEYVGILASYREEGCVKKTWEMEESNKVAQGIGTRERRWTRTDKNESSCEKGDNSRKNGVLTGKW